VRKSNLLHLKKIGNQIQGDKFMNVFLLCAAILVTFYFILSFNVSRIRLNYRKLRAAGVGGEVTLQKAIRAHGNAAEYIPLFVLLFFFFNAGGPAWLQWAAVGATASRLLHGVGMLLAKDTNTRHPLRFVGALGTYVAGLAFAYALIALALASRG
jgi:uncharacterized protein